MAIRDDIKALKELSRDELIDLRLELQIDRLSIDSDLKTAEDEGNDRSEWYNKASYAFKCKAIIMTAIDVEVNRRKKDLKWEDIFHNTAKSILSEDLYEELKEATSREYKYSKLCVN